MYFIRYQDTDLSYVERSLVPGPSRVAYPEKRVMNVRPTKDGASVVQRPLRDTRPRRWVWLGYRDTIIPYKNQWAFLETLEYRTRLEGGIVQPTVQIWEDVTSDGGFSRMDGLDKVWTTVKFLRVERVLRDTNGGPPIYDESFIEFVIEDPNYTGF